MSAASFDIRLVSFSHHNTSIEERDRLAFSEDDVAAFVPRANALLGNSEVAVLSTCNRTEFYVYGAGAGGAWDTIGPLVSETKKLAHLAAHPAEVRGEHAARHLFRVAASMESLALGEDQILAQVKEVHRQILGVGGKAPVLDRLYQFAIRCGKRVRTETTLCDGAVSIASASVELSKRIYGDLSGLEIALVGAGETAINAAEHFKASGATRFVVVNRGAERGRQLADQLHGTYRPLNDLHAVLESADVAVFATRSAQHLVEAAHMKAIMRARNHRSLFLLDISSPRNVDPAIGKVSGAFVYNIDDLTAVIRDNLKTRQREIPHAEAIVDEMVQAWAAWMQTIQVRPTIGELAQHFEVMRATEFGRWSAKHPSFTVEDVEAFSRSLSKKLLHDPIMFLRAGVDDGSLKPEEVDVLRRVFGLGQSDE